MARGRSGSRSVIIAARFADRQRVERLLAGELLDPSDLAYDFEGSHLGAIATGGRGAGAIRRLAGELGCRLLAVEHGEEVWAWLGRGPRIEPAEVGEALADRRPAPPLALGEPAPGLAGWRFTHRQARAAFPIALRRPDRISRYADVALLAAMLRDDLLADSLRRLYLAPLEHERDGGEAFRETLRAYFAAGRNVSAAAAGLGVNRNTVANRLGAIEARTGRSVADSAADFEAALRLDELDAGA